MEALTEQQLRELLTEAFEEGYQAGVNQDPIYENNVDHLVAKAHVSTMYHGKRGDAAQDYIEQFFHGGRSWDDFRWNEVWDRMNAVAPLDLRGEANGSTTE